jgi:hypothetical protein
MTGRPEGALVARPLAESLNEACQCIWVDRTKLQEQLRAQLGAASALLDTRHGLVSGSVVFIGNREAAAMDRTMRLVTRVLTSRTCQERVARDAPGIARAPRPATGGFLGFDFHLGGPVPQLIEINTNPGGLLVGLELARAAVASCDCLTESLSLLTASPAMGSDRIVQGFRDEWQRARGGAALRTVAIVDDEPQSQYLYPEFLLYQRLFERAGWRAFIADAASLAVRDDALLWNAERIDLVYNRVTDFYFDEPQHAALRAAYAADLAVITPHPAAHARWADKRLLAWLRDPELLGAAQLDAGEREHLVRTVPATEIVAAANAADLWRRRKNLFFKPADGFGGKAAYRGDRLTRTAFEHVVTHRYVAQAIAPTSFRRVANADGEESQLRLDVRNFAWQGDVLLRAARLYRGQTTNFRTPGGGFAPVLTLPD